MPRIKYYNKNTNQWEYADSQYTVGGGSGCLVVKYDQSTKTASHSASEIKAVLDRGNVVVMEVGKVHCPVHGYDDNGVIFYYELVTSSGVFCIYYTVYESKAVSQTSSDYNYSGTDIFWVTVVNDPMKNETTCKQTPDEIYREYVAGKSVLCELNNDGVKIIMIPAAIFETRSIFYTCIPNTSVCGLFTLVIREGVVQYIETSLVTGENIAEAVATIMVQAGVKTESEINEMIDEKLEGFTPDSGGNVDLAITGAEVGQTIRIAEVDENGVPTAWEAVDFPEGGGGGSEWRHIRTVTIPTDASTDTSGVSFAEKTGSGSTDYIFAFDTDKNGKSFALSELFVRYNAGTSFDGNGTNRATLGMAIISTPDTVGSIAVDADVQLKSGTKVGWFEVRYIDGNISYLTTWNMGSGANEVRGSRDFIMSGKDKGWVTALCLNLTNNLGKYGFRPGSVFEIYGR